MLSRGWGRGEQGVTAEVHEVSGVYFGGDEMFWN